MALASQIRNQAARLQECSGEERKGGSFFRERTSATSSAPHLPRAVKWAILKRTRTNSRKQYRTALLCSGYSKLYTITQVFGLMLSQVILGYYWRKGPSRAWFKHPVVQRRKPERHKRWLRHAKLCREWQSRDHDPGQLIQWQYHPDDVFEMQRGRKSKAPIPARYPANV